MPLNVVWRNSRTVAARSASARRDACDERAGGELTVGGLEQATRGTADAGADHAEAEEHADVRAVRDVTHEEHAERVRDQEHSVQVTEHILGEVVVQVLLDRVLDNAVDLRSQPSAARRSARAPMQNRGGGTGFTARRVTGRATERGRAAGEGARTLRARWKHVYEMNVTTQTRPFCHDTYAGENTGCEPCTPPSILGAGPLFGAYRRPPPNTRGAG